MPLLKRILTSKISLLVAGGAVIVIAFGFWLGWWGWFAGLVSGWVWPALALLLVLGGLIWLQWFLPRYRERRFLARLRAAEARAPGEGALASDRQLQEKMLEALRILRSSPEIRKSGGLPLYALPWFLLIGASSSGKTTLLRGVAHLFSPFARSATTQDGPTPQCDWWFFNTAIILDTAGSYAFPTPGAGEETQWYRFLQILRHYRELQPINGMLIAVGADTLALKGPDELRADAGELRKRVDEAIRELGVEFPVYVLVTRCDLIEGFCEFFGQLPESALERVLGFINVPPQTGQDRQALSLEPMFHTLIERLLQLRLSLLRDKVTSPALGQKVFCFPEEFRALQKPLGTFVETLFAENPFQHTPDFRGLFFCSAHQQGTSYSFLRQELRFDIPQMPSEGRSRHYFLHDLFSFILPRDRYLARSTARTNTVRRLRDLLTLGACLALCVILGVLLTRAFVSDRQLVVSVDTSACRPTPAVADPETLLGQMDTCRQEVQQLSERNQLRPDWAKWLFRRSGRLEARLRQQYVETFADAILTPLDAGIAQHLMGQGETIPLVFLLIDRIELISHCLSASDCPIGDDRHTPPNYLLMLDPSRRKTLAAEQALQLRYTYEAYIRWTSTSPDVLQRELEGHAEHLRRWFSAGQFAPQQVLQWASQQYPAVTLRDVWGASSATVELAQVRVEGGYTALAWQQSIQPFLRRAAEAIPDMASLLGSFQRDYRLRYFEQWQRFLAAFPQGERAWWQTPEQRRQLALRLMGSDSPYNQVLDIAYAQMTPFLPPTMLLEKVPVEVSEGVERSLAVQYLSSLWQRLVQLWPGAEDTVRELKATQLTQFTDGPIPEWVRMLYRFLQSESRANFLDALRQIQADVGDLTSSEQILQVALSGFQGERPAEQSTSPILRAWAIIRQFRGQQGSSGEPATEQVVWPLLERPVLLIWKAILEGTGEFMQKAWADQVAAPAKGLSKLERLQYLYGPQGKVQAFANQFVNPFLVEGQSRPEQVLGEVVPIPAAILTAVLEAKQSSPLLEPKTPHRVRVEATRGSVVENALGLAEDRTELVVECATKTFKVSNRGKDFAESSTTVFWSPEDCGDVVIAIFLACGQSCMERAATMGVTMPESASLRLVKRYPGQGGFLNFIQDFRTGSRLLNSQDFGGTEESVRRYRIGSVRVFYRIEVPDTLAKLMALVAK